MIIQVHLKPTTTFNIQFKQISFFSTKKIEKLFILEEK